MEVNGDAPCLLACLIAEEEVSKLRASLAGAKEEAEGLRASAAAGEVLVQAEARSTQAALQAAREEAQAEVLGMRGELESVQHKLCAAVKKGKVGVSFLLRHVEVVTLEQSREGWAV